MIMDRVSTSYEGFRPGDSEDFNSVLFHYAGLLPGKHQVELVNTASGNCSDQCVLDITQVRGPCF